MIDADGELLNDPAINTHADALELLRAFLQGAQKARSNLHEGMGDGPVVDAILTAGHPWLFGPRCIVPKLATQVTQAEAGAAIAGAELLNWAIICLRLEPLISIALPLYFPRFRALTEPDLSWAGRRFEP